MQQDSRWEKRGLMVVRGLVGGLFAGVVFAGLSIWFVVDAGLAGDLFPNVIATIPQPDEWLALGQTSPVVGWLTHFGLSAAYGMAFALLAAELKSNTSRSALALVYGIGIYVFNFLLLAPLFYPVFTTLNQPFEATVHLVFGALLIPFLVTWRKRDPDEGLPAIVQRARENEGLEPHTPATSFHPDNLR
jgi:uncharacterized membrane protein YagU involved in acid resistance